MSPQDYEIAYFAQSVWKLARSNSTDELLAVACTIRNYIFPHLGQVPAYSSFMEACDQFLLVCPSREGPKLDEDAFISSPEGLLCNIDGIYSCTFPDITANPEHPTGARFFTRVSSLNPDDWMVTVVNDQKNHTLLGTWGSMQFFS